MRDLTGTYWRCNWNSSLGSYKVLRLDGDCWSVIWDNGRLARYRDCCDDVEITEDMFNLAKIK